jgi:hypothetical protein
VASVVTLARWQLRSTWRLLLVADTGILAIVMLICLIPLYSSVAMSAALRDAFSASPENSYLVETGSSALYSRQKMQEFSQRVSHLFEQTLPGYVQPTPVFSTHLTPLTIAQNPLGRTELDFTGFPEQQIPQHVRLIAGQLPATTDAGMPGFVTTAEGLSLIEKLGMGYRIGSIFQFPVVLANESGLYVVTTRVMMPMKLVGVVSLASQRDSFWHGMDFQPVLANNVAAIPALLSNEALGRALERIEARPDMQGQVLYQPVGVSWYYPLNLARFDVSHLDDITTRVSQMLSKLNLVNNPLNLPPYVQQTQALGPLHLFQYFSDRTTLLRVPVGALAVLAGALILFFVGVVAGLLIDQQGDQIAFLRSRGAARRQIVGALSVQSALLALPVLILGPMLAWVLALWLPGITLQGDDRNAVNVLLAQPLASMLGVGWIALVVILVAVLVMALALWQRVRATTVTRRRETTRDSRPALWKRWRLDLVGALVALAGSAFALYLANAGVLNTRTRALILPVILLGAALGLLVAAILLVFRGFPLLLRWGAGLALRRRGATAVLAVAQMARSPLQAARMSLLLAFTLAFAIFTLTFSTSQAQRIADSVGFQVGSDFSGVLSGPATVGEWQSTEQAYAQIPGVRSATIGHVGIMGSNSISLEIEALDTNTAGQTMDWNASGSFQQVSSWLRQMAAQRQANITARIVPAILDVSSSRTLGLAVGSQFTLTDQNGAITFVVLGVVPNLPGLLDDSTSTGTSDVAASGGVLADYATFAGVQVSVNGLADAAESMWLKTGDGPATLAGIRKELNGGEAQLEGISDRRAIVASLAYDPLQAAVEGGLGASAAVALALGLVGSLFGSWANARRRVVNFALMRALGNTPGQIVEVVLWEQAIIYLLALVLGVGGGLLFSQVAVPGLLYTPVINVGFTQALANGTGLNQAGIGQLYLVQTVPPAHAVLPLPSILAVIGIVVLVSALALGIVVRLAVRPALSEILRLNED